jgi:hypothetical protein
MPDLSANSNRPCILRAWNNYYGYTRYETLASDHQNILSYFYTFTPPTHTTLAIPSSYFHIAIQLKWIDILQCAHLFVVNGTHIYYIKKMGITSWQKYDWPFSESYATLHDLSQTLHHTLFVIFLYSAEATLRDTLITCIQAWKPKHTVYYTTFRRRLLEELRRTESA